MSEKLKRDILQVVDQAFSETRQALTIFCRKYQVAEGDFPFSPYADRRIHVDGSQERILSDLFVLTLDMIHSTDSQATNALKDAILRTFAEFPRPGFFYEYTGNDSYVAACSDPAPLWDVARSIRTQAEMLKRQGDALDGTRKGLSHGTLRIITRPDGAVRITDASYPNLLPRAFYMLKGVDKYCENEPSRRNSILVVESATLERFRNALPGTLTELGQVLVEAKHFYGNCIVVNIS